MVKHTEHSPLVLIILDGWGYSQDPAHNAIAAAKTPFWHSLWQQYPHTLAVASGLAVGLPKDQMGNSEVGHLHMGAGRQVPQDLTQIDLAIESGEFQKNSVITQALSKVKSSDRSLHILGLLSPGGVHSHQAHIMALIQLAAEQGLKKVYLHAFLDGRDTPPKSAQASLTLVEQLYQDLGCGQIASLTGRYYAMDRDKRWERTQRAYDLLTLGQSDFTAATASAGLQAAYTRNETDEFVQPTAIHAADQTPITIEDGDTVIFMNFRADRARQLTRALTDPHFKDFPRTRWPQLAEMVTLTQYAEDIAATVAFPPITLTNNVGEYVSKCGYKQLRIAETEKYAHVTFFFNGGEEQPYPNEDRKLIPSPKVATYDLQPEMSAVTLTDALIIAIESQQYDLIVCNFANPDMVGHTGNFDATTQAIEVIDHCLQRIVKALQTCQGEAVITADHGNAECMYNPATGQPHTAHTTNLVPVIYVGRPATPVTEEGVLYDIGPTVLYLMGLEKPAEMTGRALFKLN
ncbi:MAG: 2,3-bisphosphoglycerate-independent phosphoglycerate mutase [Gammaproteobacteria bacterium]